MKTETNYSEIELKTKQIYLEQHKNYFKDEWWDGLIQFDDNVSISNKYNKK